MTREVKIDLISHDPQTDENVLYLVENGPWPDADEQWSIELSRIQGRIFDAFEIAVDGHLKAKYPDMGNKAVRIQVDMPFGEPVPVLALVERINEFVKQDAEYLSAVHNSRYVSSIRVVTGHQMGRFLGDRKQKP